MAIPSTIIQFSTTDPTATPVWETISSEPRTAPRSWSMRRGRQRELERLEAGTGAIVFRDPDRRLDPSNATGPYYPNLRPMRRFRVRATFDAMAFDVFHAYAEGYPQRWSPGPSGDAWVTVNLVDAFKVLALAKVTITRSAELSGARINAILDAISWPAADRAIDAGLSQVQAVTLTDEPALRHLQDVAFTEAGLFYAARDGKLTFRDRSKAVTTVLDLTNHTWGDAATEKGYADVAYSPADDSLIWNEIKVEAPSLATQTATDATSRNRYFPRTRIDATIHSNTNEMKDRADYMVTRYAEPAGRITELQLEARSEDAQWEHILHHDIGDKIRVRKRPPGGGLIEQDSFIEGISHDVTARGWRTVWNLSPVDRVGDYFIWGTSRWGIDTRWFW